MKIQIIKDVDITYLNELLFKDGILKVVDSSVYKKIPYDHLRIFCVKNGIYQLPTTELIEWLLKKIDGRRAIEIGSGNGAIGKELGIIATDSYMQERPEIASYYNSINQTPVKYGSNVKKFNGENAIKKFKPEVVIACWVTQIWKPDSNQGNYWGIDEEWIINSVDTYIHVGNKDPHKKRILKFSHDEYQFSWLFSRAAYHEKNIIYEWNRKKKNDIIYLGEK